jgi:hypothetical protein
VESREAFDRFFGETVQPTIVELVGAEAMQQGSPPRSRTGSYTTTTPPDRGDRLVVGVRSVLAGETRPTHQ